MTQQKATLEEEAVVTDTTGAPCGEYRLCRVRGYPFLENGHWYMTRRTDFALFIEVCMDDDFVIRCFDDYFHNPSFDRKKPFQVVWRKTLSPWGFAKHRYGSESKYSWEFHIGPIHFIRNQP